MRSKFLALLVAVLCLALPAAAQKGLPVATNLTAEGHLAYSDYKANDFAGDPNPIVIITKQVVVDYQCIPNPGNPPPGNIRVYCDSGTGVLTCLNSAGGSCGGSSTPASATSPFNSAAAASPIKLVQTPGVFTAFSSVSTFTQAYQFANTAGNLGVVMINQFGVSAINSVTDTQGNTWFAAGLPDIVSAIYYCPSLKAGADTVSVNFAVAVSGGVSVAEYSGHFAAHPLSNGTLPNGSNAMPLGSINVPVAGSLVVVVAANNGGTGTYADFTGMTPRVPTVAVTGIWGDSTNTTAGSNVFGFSQSCASGCPDFIIAAVVFLPSNYVVPATPQVIHQAEGAIATSGLIIPSQASPATDVFPGGNSAGNVIVLAVRETGTTGHITAVTDTAGNTYTRLTGGGDIADSVGHSFYSIYTAPVLATSFLNNTVSVAMSSGTAQVAPIEVTGITGVRDANANGAAAFNLATNSLNDLIVSNVGFSGGGAFFRNQSGLSVFTSATMDVNVFASCSKNNAITANFISAGQFPGNDTVALLPTSTAGCSGSAGSQAVSTNFPTTTLVGTATGVLSPSVTLGFYGLGQRATPTGTSVVVANGEVMQQTQAIIGFNVVTATAGINASSGVVSLLKNGAAFSPPITCTLGSAVLVCVDFAHPNFALAGDVVSATITTQAAETLSNVVITVIKSP